MKYDIVIVGGGMVGAALACALQDSPFRIVLMDAALSHAEDHRLIALNYASSLFFEKLGIWPDLLPHATAIHEVHVSNRGYFGTTRLMAKEMGVSQLGYVVPAREINTALYTVGASLKNVTFLQGAKLTTLSQQPAQVELTYTHQSKQEKMDAQIVIGADGTFSTVRELLQIPTETIDYQQKALVTITTLQRSHHHIAYERFLSTGAIAMLPLAGNHAATIWSGDEKYIDELLKLSDADFLTILQTVFGYRLGKLIKTHERFSYPLKFVKAKQSIKERVILIGNALHTIHPIAAQGLNIALYEVERLALYLKQPVTNELSFENLPAFSTQENKTIDLSHQLAQLFSTDFFLINTARQLGMIGLDFCLPLKKRFGKRMLGMMNSMF